MIDLAPTRRLSGCHVLQHFRDFDAAFKRDCIEERFTRPADEKIRRKIAGGEDAIRDDAFRIDDEDNVT